MKLYKNATIMPLQGTMDAFVGGIITDESDFVEDCLPHRGSRPVFSKAQKSLQGIYIYGGCLFAHFIWESLAHISAFRQCRNYPIVFITPNKDIFNMQRLFLKEIGVTNELILITEPTLIENLIYSSPGCSITPLFISDEFLKDMVRYDVNNFHIGTEYDKIWLSRSGLRKDKFRQVENEIEIENKLAEIGYRIVHPEILPLREQVRLLCTTNTVAGFDGSAFYSLFFANGARGKFYIFNSRPNIVSALPYMFEKKGLDYSLHTYAIEPVEDARPCQNWRMLEPDQIVELLAKK